MRIVAVVGLPLTGAPWVGATMAQAAGVYWLGDAAGWLATKPARAAALPPGVPEGTHTVVMVCLSAATLKHLLAVEPGVEVLHVHCPVHDYLASLVRLDVMHGQVGYYGYHWARQHKAMARLGAQAQAYRPLGFWEFFRGANQPQATLAHWQLVPTDEPVSPAYPFDPAEVVPAAATAGQEAPTPLVWEHWRASIMPLFLRTVYSFTSVQAVNAQLGYTIPPTLAHQHNSLRVILGFGWQRLRYKLTTLVE